MIEGSGGSARGSIALDGASCRSAVTRPLARGRLALVLFALAALAASLPRPATAQTAAARHTESFPVPNELSRTLDPSSAPSRRWSLEPSGTMRPRVRRKVSSNGTVCLWIGLERDNFAFIMDPKGKFVGGRNASSIDCSRGWGSGRPLALRVFVAVSDAERERLGADGEFRIGWPVVPTDRGSVMLEELDWVLEARTVDGDWQPVAAVGPGSRTEGSGWVDDPDRPTLPALVLADPLAVPGAAAAAVVTPIATAETPPARSSRPARAATLAEAELEFSLDGHGGPAGLYVMGAPDLAVPVVDWVGDESIGRLRLQVVEPLSDPARGSYCVRAVYDDDGTARRLGRLADGRFSTAAPAPPGTPGVCEAEAELLFPIHVVGDVFARKPGRFLINGPPGGGGASLALEEARVVLRSGDERLASNDGAPGGGWFLDGEGRPALLLRADNVGGVTGLRYVSLPAGVGEEVRLDGVPWADGERRDVPDSTLALDWDAAVRTPSRVLLCRDERCEQPFAVLAAADTGIDIDPRAIVPDIGRPTVTIGVDWSEDGAAAGTLAPRASAAGPSDATAGADATSGADLVFAPSVSWGGYSRALTSCLGHLVAGDWRSEPFSLRRGLQVLDAADLPASIANDARVHVSFASGRDGEDCAVAGLRTAELTLGELRARGAGGEIALDVPLGESLFVGYLQLNNRVYASSLARWKNALEFFDRLYVQGHERGRWADGVLFGAGERSGVVPRLEPAANFVSTLGDSTLMREIARTQRDNRRVASQFFGDQLEALAELFGDQPVELVYYDDLAADCRVYAEDLARAPLRTTRVVVVAGIDGYTANDGALRSLPGRLAHVCVEDDELVVYAFNWRERADNEDFLPMLTTVLEDLERREENVQ